MNPLKNHDMKRLSIIIVTYNSEHDIFDCVRSIQQYNDLQKDELELIVVDNKSNNPEPMFTALRQQWGDDIILISNDRNGGYGQGNNVGIRQASASVLLIMNPDVRLMEPVFKEAVEAFEREPRLTMLGMKQMFDEHHESPYSFTATYMMNGYLQTILSVLGNRTDCYLPRWMHFSGSCFFLSREKFLSVGLFDETNFMYGEEDDIHYRLYQRYGSSMRYMPRLHYIHPMHQRKPDVDYERKLVDVAIAMNEKKGYPRLRTVRNRLKNVELLIFFTRIKRLLGRSSADYLDFLYARRRMLKDYLANE